LCEQWQTELLDKLGIPTARWQTTKKVWLDSNERSISPAGAEHIAACPLRIGIVSTGLMMRDSNEKQHLLDLSYGLVILDEAHKARSRQGFGKNAGEPNELLSFITAIAARADHVLLGTATPIQTTPEDLWDLVRVLHQGKGNFVLGNDYARWHKPAEVLPILSGEQEVTDLANAWELLRSPLPPVNSTADNPVRLLYSAIRQDLGLSTRQFEAGRLADLDIGTRQDFGLELDRRVANAPFFSVKIRLSAMWSCGSAPRWKRQDCLSAWALMCILMSTGSRKFMPLMPCLKAWRCVPMNIFGKPTTRPNCSARCWANAARAADL
jgi:hypothetical protein